MVGTPLLSPVSAHHCPVRPLSPPTIVLCHHCPITVPSHCHLIPPPSHPSSCPLSPIPPPSHTAITSSHRCHPHPTLPPLSVTVPSCTAVPSHRPPPHHPALSLSSPTTVPAHHHPLLPPSCPITVPAHHSPIPPPSHPTTTVPFCHQPSPSSHPSRSLFLAQPVPVSCQGRGQRDHTQATRVPICLGPPPCATRLCHTGSCYPCPLRAPPQHHHPPPSLLGIGNCMPHVPPLLNHVPTCVPTGQGGLVLPPEPAVPPSCHRSRGGPGPPTLIPLRILTVFLNVFYVVRMKRGHWGQAGRRGGHGDPPGCQAGQGAAACTCLHVLPAP